jgi:hypothetical protein
VANFVCVRKETICRDYSLQCLQYNVPFSPSLLRLSQRSTRNFNFGWSLARFVFPKPQITCFSSRKNPAVLCTALKRQEFCTLNGRVRIRVYLLAFPSHTTGTLVWLLIRQRPIRLASDGCSISSVLLLRIEYLLLVVGNLRLL